MCSFFKEWTFCNVISVFKTKPCIFPHEQVMRLIQLCCQNHISNWHKMRQICDEFRESTARLQDRDWKHREHLEIPVLAPEVVPEKGRPYPCMETGLHRYMQGAGKANGIWVEGTTKENRYNGSTTAVSRPEFPSPVHPPPSPHSTGLIAFPWMCLYSQLDLLDKACSYLSWARVSLHVKTPGNQLHRSSGNARKKWKRS